MRPDGTEPMTPADLRPGDEVMNFEGWSVKVTSVEAGRYGLLVKGKSIDKPSETYTAYFLVELPPPSERTENWRGFASLNADIIGGKRWTVCTLWRSDSRPRIPATYDAILDEWRAEQASSGGKSAPTQTPAWLPRYVARRSQTAPRGTGCKSEFRADHHSHEEGGDK